MTEEQPGRIPMFICVVGTNGTGKTYYARNTLAHTELNKPGGKVLVITPHQEEWQGVEEIHPTELRHFYGLRKIFFFDHEETLFKDIIQYMYNGMIIFDDCKFYLGSTIEQKFNRLLISRKQIRCDMVCIAHSLSEIPRKFFVYNPRIVLFRTTIPPYNRKDVLFDFERICEEIENVNKRAESTPHYHKIIKL